MLFGKEKLEVPDEYWDRLLGSKKENRFIGDIQDIEILKEIDTLIEHSKPEDAYFRIMKIRGMISISHGRLCNMAEKKGETGEVKMK